MENFWRDEDMRQAKRLDLEVERDAKREEGRDERTAKRDERQVKIILSLLTAFGAAGKYAIDTAITTQKEVLSKSLDFFLVLSEKNPDIAKLLLEKGFGFVELVETHKQASQMAWFSWTEKWWKQSFDVTALVLGKLPIEKLKFEHLISAPADDDAEVTFTEVVKQVEEAETTVRKVQGMLDAVRAKPVKGV
jgi:hypothetical protein